MDQNEANADVGETEPWFEELEWLKDETEAGICKLLEDKFSGTSDYEFQWSILLNMLLFLHNESENNVQNAARRAQAWKAANDPERYRTEIADAIQRLGMLSAKMALQRLYMRGIERFSVLDDEM